MRRFLAIIAFVLAAVPVGATTHYIDYTSGNDSNAGTSKAAPWKHAPGMLGINTSGGSTGDGCSANCASYSPAAGDSIILKGGTVWPYTVLPWQWTWSGSGSTTTYGCTGSGCIYVGYDPTWNQGKVNSVTVTRDLGGCAFPSVNFSAGGGSGAAATAGVIPSTATGDGYTNVVNFIYHIAVTSQGSGYTSDPTVAIVGCTLATAVADIYRPVIDAGGSWNSSTLTASGPVWPVGTGSGALEFGPVVQVYANNTIWDHLELRNVTQANRTTGVQSGMINLNGSSGNNTVENSYIHGRFVVCVQQTSCDAQDDTGQQDAGIIAADGQDEFAYNTVENGDSFYIGTAATDCGGSYFAVGGPASANYPCQFSESSIKTAPGTTGDVEIQHNKIYSVMWQVHGGENSSATLPLLIHDNEMWLTLYNIGGDHENELYIQSAGPTGVTYEYNNIDHNNVNGSSNQDQMGNGTTHYMFNNVEWTMGGGTPNWGLDYATGAGPNGGHYYFYNNTMLWDATGTGECLDSGGLPTTYSVDMIIVIQNNFCMTTANPYWLASAAETWKDQTGSTVVGDVTAASTVLTLSAANGQGYVQGNLYAPTSPSNSTVTFATGSGTANLTALCSGYLTALCSDINGNPRPTSGGWQSGARTSGSAESPTVLITFPGCGSGCTSYNYGNQTTNTTSAAQTFTATNTGSVPLIMSSETLSVGSQFALTANSCGSNTIMPAASCSVSVTFTPTSVGSKADTLTFTDDASPTTQTVALSGTGMPAPLTPTFSLAPTNAVATLP